MNNDEEDGIQEEKLRFAEYVVMLGKINKCFFLDDVIYEMLSTITRNLKNSSLQMQKKINKVTLNIILPATIFASHLHFI